MQAAARADWPDPGRRAPADVRAFVGLGANLGDAPATLAWALQALGDLPATRCEAHSVLYRTAPVECAPGSPDFFNAVAELQTRLTAPDLLRALQSLEARAGRERPYRHAPRTLDLDLLLYGQARVESPTLTLPHPRLHERAFVLQPLADIAPGQVSPAALQAVRAQPIQRIAPLTP